AADRLRTRDAPGLAPAAVPRAGSTRTPRPTRAPVPRHLRDRRSRRLRRGPRGPPARRRRGLGRMGAPRARVRGVDLRGAPPGGGDHIEHEAGEPMSAADDWWFQRSWNGFRVGTATARLEWDGGFAAVRLYDEGVPRTVAAIQALLPIAMPFVHAAWSGEMVMGAETVELDNDEPENAVRLVRPGDLTWDHKYGELCVVYGDAECRLPSGPNTVTVYGEVSDGLDAVADFCRRRRF